MTERIPREKIDKLRLIGFHGMLIMWAWAFYDTVIAGTDNAFWAINLAVLIVMWVADLPESIIWKYNPASRTVKNWFLSFALILSLMMFMLNQY